MDSVTPAATTEPASARMAEGVAEIGRLIDPEPLIRRGRNWTHYVGPAVSLLILGAVLYQLRMIDLPQLWQMLPAKPDFWVLFAITYLTAPLSEWIIFRRLWELPVGGFAALLRKLVSNEILLGYLGEVYFYSWARRHAHVVAAPFGAIKDVTILSALAGNITSLVLFVIAAPLMGSLNLGVSTHSLMLSGAFVLVTSFILLILRKSLFTLPRPELRFIFVMHMIRIGATLLFSAIMWHLLLPAVALTWWILLGALRQLLSRLPLLPNKDLVFAGLAAFLASHDAEIIAAMALMASLILAAHLAVGAGLAVSGLFNGERT